MTTAFDPYDLAGRRLANRIAMAPMTRSRASGPGATPTELMATYYAQRAGAGLIVTEGIQPSPVGQGYPNTPGLHSDAQVAAWRTVTAAVHARGGVIFAQLMHAGRIGHASLRPGGPLPVGPSAVPAAVEVFTAEGLRPSAVPRALTEDDILGTIRDYADAARNAIDAGFDGVELHGANGYLIHQFLSANANRRTDGWGGSVEGRIRFAVEVSDAVVAAVGRDRVGVRISPFNPFNDITEADAEEMYAALIARLDVAYLHVLESGDHRDLTLRLHKEWPGTVLLNAPDVPGPERLGLIEDGTADVLTFGALFLANPDLPARLAAGGPFNEPDLATAYSGDHRGYVDYPALAG
ncbi:alkene reductase [Cryptosporangium arvum]|uniref:alkene reductase n=1 Tax=Cryptosporangium arvum TaxID=80871 RepID=UPI0004B54701|nr:alkene reductase [Cryptosporangium arvum]